MVYRVRFKNSAARIIRKLPKEIQGRVIEKAGSLAENPRPHDSKKLHGENLYRVRVGDYRIVYTIEDNVLMVLVATVGHRREVYRKH
jgi:mRNA interferase RelE/StbE